MLRAFGHESLVGSFMVVSLSYFSFQSVLHDWCNKGHGMYYRVWDDTYKRILAANCKE